MKKGMKYTQMLAILAFSNTCQAPMLPRGRNCATHTFCLNNTPISTTVLHHGRQWENSISLLAFTNALGPSCVVERTGMNKNFCIYRTSVLMLGKMNKKSMKCRRQRWWKEKPCKEVYEMEMERKYNQSTMTYTYKNVMMKPSILCATSKINKPLKLKKQNVWESQAWWLKPQYLGGWSQRTEGLRLAQAT